MRSLFRKLFAPRTVSRDAVFSEFPRSLTLIVDHHQLLNNIMSRITEFVDCSTLVVYIFDPDLERYDVLANRGYVDEQTVKTPLDANGSLIRWLNLNDMPLVVNKQPEVMSYLSDDERRLIVDSGTELIVPLIAMNRCNGVVFIGPRSAGGDYGREEIDALSSMLGQGAIAVENAILAGQQKQRLKKMYRADRLATIGQLAAGAAHEIRNPLASIRSTIQYLQKYMVAEEHQQMVADLNDEVDRINGIIEGMLSFSRPQKPKIETVCLEAIITQTLGLVATTARKQSVALDYDSGREPVMQLRADPAQIKQVFLNIVLNALQAMPRGGRLTVRTDHLAQRDYTHGGRGGYRITFTDTGSGIPHDQLEQVFNPFFTTKSDGTGLGLSISYGIVHQHGGEIEIESRFHEEYPETSGTDIRVILPDKK